MLWMDEGDEQTEVLDDEEEHAEVTIDSRTGETTARNMVQAAPEPSADGEKALRSRNLPNQTTMHKSRFSNNL